MGTSFWRRFAVVVGLGLLGVVVTGAIGLGVLVYVGLQNYGPDDDPMPSRTASESELRVDGTTMPEPEPLPGDTPPNAADNNAWKERADVPPEDERQAEESLRRAVLALTPLAERGEFSTAAVRAALDGAGLDRTGFGWISVVDPQEGRSRELSDGVQFGVQVSRSACVVGYFGEERPEVSAQITGVAVEFGCLEPFSH